MMVGVLLLCVFLAGRASLSLRLTNAERALSEERKRAAKAAADYDDLAQKHERLKRQSIELLIRRTPRTDWHDDPRDYPIWESDLKRILREGASGFPLERSTH
jgi:hypothetical protein